MTFDRCWRCGRAVPEWSGTSYVFGRLCERSDCKRVDQALNPRFKRFWFQVMLPDGEFRGRGASFTVDGEPNDPSGLWSMSTARKREADEMLKAEAKQ